MEENPYQCNTIRVVPQLTQTQFREKIHEYNGFQALSREGIFPRGISDDDGVCAVNKSEALAFEFVDEAEDLLID